MCHQVISAGAPVVSAAAVVSAAVVSEAAVVSVDEADVPLQLIKEKETNSRNTTISTVKLFQIFIVLRNLDKPP